MQDGRSFPYKEEVMKNLVLLVGLSLALAGCSGSNPAGPTVMPDAPGSTLTVLSARIGTPIVGASVIIGADKLFTDAGGIVRISSANNGQVALVQAPACIDKRFPLVKTGMTVWMVSNDARLPMAYTDAAIYGGGSYGIFRPVSSVITLVPDGFMRQGREWDALTFAAAAHNEVNARISRPDVRLLPAMQIAEPGSTGPVSIKIYQDPNDPIFSQPGYENAGAVTFRITDGYKVVGGRIVFRNTSRFWGEHLKKAMMHEIGHIRGLGHSPGGIMSSAAPITQFIPAEEESMLNLVLLPPGTRSPDDETNADAGFLSHGLTERVVCSLRSH